MSLPLRKVMWASAVGLLGLIGLLRTQFQLALAAGDSMAPTLSHGDLLIVSRRAYQQKEPRRGDIVVARYGREWIVKRIVGLPHEEVEVQRGTLYVNGRPCPEGHLIQPGSLNLSKGLLCAGRFALLGDNRALPLTLVVHGVVAKEDIVGKVILTVRLPHPFSRAQLGCTTMIRHARPNLPFHL